MTALIHIITFTGHNSIEYMFKFLKVTQLNEDIVVAFTPAVSH